MANKGAVELARAPVPKLDILVSPSRDNPLVRDSHGTYVVPMLESVLASKVSHPRQTLGRAIAARSPQVNLVAAVVEYKFVDSRLMLQDGPAVRARRIGKSLNDLLPAVQPDLPPADVRVTAGADEADFVWGGGGMVDDQVLQTEHVDHAVLQGVQPGARGNVPDNDLLVGATADQEVLAPDRRANDGLDKVCVADVFPARRPRGQVPGPDVLVPGPGKEDARVGATDGDAADWSGWTAVCGLGIIRVLNANIREMASFSQESRHTLRLTKRTAPADSATRSEDDGDLGSGMAARILDFREMGLPYLLPALAARRCRFSWAAL